MTARFTVLEWLERTGRTQNGFAAELGMQSSKLSMILTGQRRMSLKDALKAVEISSLPIETFHRLRSERATDEQANEAAISHGAGSRPSAA